MKRVPDEDLAPFLAILDAYNQCFYERNLAALRKMYARDGCIVFFDNHRDCDSIDLEDHLRKVDHFFKMGKETESGDIEPLSVESPMAFTSRDSALVTATLRYQSAPRPGVRASFVLNAEHNSWRIRHIHFSFDPNEQS